jgi:uncharacterized 2Fe-2S/4Fe-4S cluster protein (DUF4445 family)
MSPPRNISQALLPRKGSSNHLIWKPSRRPSINKKVTNQTCQEKHRWCRILKVTINPLDRIIQAKKGDILLDLLREAGIRIENPCGGKGDCGKCRVIHEFGDIVDINAKSEKHMTAYEFEQGYRLACAVRLLGDAVFVLPAESRTVNPKILSATNLKTSGISVNGGQAGLALDIGTTTIVGLLVNKRTGHILSTSSTLNRQITYGEGLLTRIDYAKTKKGLMRLQNAVVDSVNEVIGKLTIDTGMNPIQIDSVTAGGNTVMNHLLAGISPVHLEDPMSTVSRAPIIKKADILGINVNPKAQVYCLPNVSRFVGGDAVGDVLASGMHNSPEISLLVDLGTNGEIILGNSRWLISTSCASGPAFEGEGIRHGMRAAEGSIDKVTINPVSMEAIYTVIGGGRPKGICGSGLIDLVTELNKVGIVDFVGKIIPGAPLVREGKWGYEYVVVPGVKTGVSSDIVFTQTDLDYFMDSKAAVCGSVTVLMNKMKLKVDDIKQIYLAGAFGNYTNIDNITRLGVLPEYSQAEYHPIGNGSLSGAYLTLTSEDVKRKADEVAGNMVYFDLLLDSDFMDEYSKALYLPGAREYFPNIYRT